MQPCGSGSWDRMASVAHFNISLDVRPARASPPLCTARRSETMHLSRVFLSHLLKTCQDFFFWAPSFRPVLSKMPASRITWPDFYPFAGMKIVQCNRITEFVVQAVYKVRIWKGRIIKSNAAQELVATTVRETTPELENGHRNFSKSTCRGAFWHLRLSKMFWSQFSAHTLNICSREM